MFTNVANPMSWNFDKSKVDASLADAIQFPLDNPVAVQKKFLELSKQKGITPAKVEKLRNIVKDSEQNALEMLVELFDWVDMRTPQPTKDIVSLYTQTQSIDQNIANALSRMDASAKQQIKLQKIIDDLGKAEQDIDYYKDRTVVETDVEVLVQVKTERHNTLCTGIADCRSNCHEGCGLDFALKDSELADCSSMQPTGTVCNVCHHPRQNHKHFNVKWDTETQKQKQPNPEAVQRLKDARTAKDAQQQAREIAQGFIDEYARDIETYTDEIARLAEEYSKLALSGSFAGQVEKSVQLLDYNLEKMKSNGTPSETIAQVQSCRNSMQAKLDLLKKARADERKQRVTNGVLNKLVNYLVQ
ncbi:hypothetical protein PsYK624_088020 [Phanerochaete sordida]|uniref:Uncharacterized protein n=1 Tax=Phanerochaete sordida TaxID=48140 RepID=A0A9P3GBC9_9APHY|nr:hypothetical protein PsYK624_088020 [Phanerochaete sordida]